MSWDEELETFKKCIDLREYAASLGYMMDKRESDRRVTVMRRGPDKVNIRVDVRSGDWIWSSFRDNRGGSIIHFVRDREGIGNLGEIRKRLRPWIGRIPSGRVPRLSRTESR